MVDPTATVWAEALGAPDPLQRTLDDAAGFSGVADLLRESRRIVVTGNGAAYYVALAMDLAALETPGAPEIRSVPAGLLATDRFAWRAGDVLLAISSSGEQRDVIEALDRGAPRPYAAVTSNPEGTIGAGASACALVQVDRQESATHTQAYLGNLAAVLRILAGLAGDDQLERELGDAPTAVAAALETAAGWQEELTSDWTPDAVVAFGSGSVWAGALEAALLCKEVARVPAEGLETREGATSGMYALSDAHAVLSLPTADDPQVAEAEKICAGTGARVLRARGGQRHARRLGPLTTFPDALTLAVTLAQRRGIDPDSPDWAAAYYETTRTSTRSS